MSTLFSEELGLPVRGRSMRETRKPNLPAGESMVLFDADTPGCIQHWWMTCRRCKADNDSVDTAQNLMLRFYYDGESEPSIHVSLAKFFGVLFDFDVYEVASAPLKILPANAFNCYLPIPFERLRIEIENKSSGPAPLWFMADWQQFDKEKLQTAKRLRVFHNEASPAEAAGSFVMGEFSGDGFIAGIMKGVRVKDQTDAWYHTGGDLWLLDGETDPHALRGIGGEDIFNMSFGIWDRQTEWVGAPYLQKKGEDSAEGSGYEGVMYRFFGPDPVWFEHSALIRFGSKANDLESVVFAYVEPTKTEPGEIFTVPSWSLAGPFECDSREAFEREEWADGEITSWPESHTADFGQYVPDEPTTFPVPQKAPTEHGWCDFARFFRGRARTNAGTQPTNVSAYAVGGISLPADGQYLFHVGFDDWLRLWIDDEVVYEGEHADGFAVEEIPVNLKLGEHSVRVKLANFDNVQWRLWAFSMTATKA